MKMESLHELYIAELADLYNAENQILKALPKMIEKAGLTELRSALQEHLEQTREHALRLEQIFHMHGEELKNEKCEGMKGIISEGDDLIGKNSTEAVRDAAIISAAQKVEHYEIAGYGTARTFAEQMGHTEAAGLLQKTLDEEAAADEKLTKIATSRANIQATRSA